MVDFPASQLLRINYLMDRSLSLCDSKLSGLGVCVNGEPIICLFFDSICVRSANA